MKKTEIRVEPAEAFFERGRKTARLADRQIRIPPRRVVGFEDVESLVHLLTEQRLLLLKQVKESPASIASLATRLKRDRSAVTRDIRVLEKFGIVQVTEKVLPGHGKQKWITPLAREIQVTAHL